MHAEHLLPCIATRPCTTLFVEISKATNDFGILSSRECQASQQHQVTPSGIDRRTTKQVVISINEATMPMLPKVADCASWSLLTFVLAVTITVLIYFKHKKLSSLTKNSIAQTRQVLGLQWHQVDFGHEKNDCEHWLGGFVLWLSANRFQPDEWPSRSRSNNPSQQCVIRALERSESSAVLDQYRCRRWPARSIECSTHPTLPSS